MLHRKFRTKLGFTLAEMLLVVAIIIILAGVAFIAVQRYQRSLEQLEYDGVAKEIFLAAQNHLTMAESQGYLGMTTSDFGTEETEVVDGKNVGTGIYYFVIGDNSAMSNDVLSLMLPNFSIDDTVRLGGSYIVRYQKSPAQVLDVFYSDKKDTRFGFDFSKATYSAIFPSLAGDSNKLARMSYTYGDYKDRVIGYYGGVDALALLAAEKLGTPALNVYNSINKDRLYVTVTAPKEIIDSGARVRLTITGVTSGNTHTIEQIEFDTSSIEGAKYVYQEVLDSITESDKHFARQFCYGADALFPGEDIIIRAEIYKDALISYGNEMRTNSLFASLSDDGTTVELSSLRHLANLGANISGFEPGMGEPANSSIIDSKPFDVSNAKLISDINWSTFAAAVDKTSDTAVLLYISNDEENPGKFIPIQPSGQLDFDGQKHIISGLDISTSSVDAGLFQSMSGGSVRNLELLDIKVVSSGADAGTVMGKTPINDTEPGTSIENVLVHGSGSVSAAGNAGGLVGSTSGGSVAKCASAVTVSGGTTAGGLIGSASNTDIFSSYTGGHTSDGVYKKWTDANGFDVTASGIAGGLVGSYSGGTVATSYSTCSASGATAGGFAGNFSGSVSNSYATGLVDGTTANGPFACSFTGTATKCNYYEAVNEKKEGKTITYLKAKGNADIAGVTALDENAYTYDTFCGSAEDWKPADCFDDMLGMYYQGKYNLKTVSQLELEASTDNPPSTTIGVNDFVYTHYGDWPAPEIITINLPN